MANHLARALRKRLTPQEIKLWVKLRELRAILAAGSNPHPAQGSTAKRPPNMGDPPHKGEG